MKIKYLLLLFVAFNYIQLSAQNDNTKFETEEDPFFKKIDTIKTFNLNYSRVGHRGERIITIDSKGNSMVAFGISDEEGKYDFYKKITFSSKTFILTKNEIVKKFLDFYDSRKDKSCKKCADGSFVTIKIKMNKIELSMESLNNPQSVNKDYKDFEEYMDSIFGNVEN